LIVSGSSNNPSLVPNGNIAFGGSGANRTVTITPALNQSGTATITVTVSDGALSTPTSFGLTVTAVNDAPTISAIANQTTSAGAAVGPLSFTVGDAETAAASLIVSGSSNKQTLVPDANIVFGGSAANRTVTVTPAAGQTGTATITVTVSDGTASTPTSFGLTVNAVPAGLRAAYAFSEGQGPNTADASGNVNTGVLTNGPTWTTGRYGNAISFDGVNDFVTAPDSASLDLTTTGTIEAWVRLNAVGLWHGLIAKGNANTDSAHNYALEVTNGNRARCILGNGGTFQVLDSVLTLAAGTFRHLACTWNGTTLALYVDGALNASAAQTVTPAGNTAPLFLGQFGGNSDRLNGILDEVRIYSRALAVGEIQADMNTPIAAAGPNTPPTISAIGNQTTNEDTSTGAIAFTVGDNETLAASLTLSGSSSNPTLVPNANIAFGGSGANRTVTVTPAANQNGTATITITVSDGVLTTPTSFGLTVNAVNDAPTISAIANQVTTSGVAVGPLSFTVGDVETAAASLNVSGSSNNQTLVPNGSIAFGGSGASRTVTVTPAPGATGSATITITVSDGVASTPTSFGLTVTASNTAPTISPIANRTTNEDTSTGAIAFTVGDGQTAAGSLTVSGSSNNVVLVPNGSIVFGGTGANRTVTITPAPNQNGSATITITVSDGQLSTPTSFVVTVTAINDAPTISAIANQNTSVGVPVGPLSFTVGDVETAAGSLVVSGSSDNLVVVPSANIVFGGSGANRTVTVTPAPNQTGTVNITITVSDGAASALRTFRIRVRR
jgi:hypothetical protein